MQILLAVGDWKLKHQTVYVLRHIIFVQCFAAFAHALKHKFVEDCARNFVQDTFVVEAEHSCTMYMYNAPILPLSLTHTCWFNTVTMHATRCNYLYNAVPNTFVLAQYVARVNPVHVWQKPDLSSQTGIAGWTNKHPRTSCTTAAWQSPSIELQRVLHTYDLKSSLQSIEPRPPAGSLLSHPVCWCDQSSAIVVLTSPPSLPPRRFCFTFFPLHIWCSLVWSYLLASLQLFSWSDNPLSWHPCRDFRRDEMSSTASWCCDNRRQHHTSHRLRWLWLQRSIFFLKMV